MSKTYVVSENTEIVLNGEKFLLEEGDKIIINEDTTKLNKLIDLLSQNGISSKYKDGIIYGEEDDGELLNYIINHINEQYGESFELIHENGKFKINTSVNT